MEHEPKEHLPEIASCGEAIQVAADCLGVPLILRKILLQMSNADLLKLSLVNKLWNYEARSVMRKHRSLTATLKFTDSCQSLTNFASDLSQMNVVPFSGIDFVLTPKNSHVCQPSFTEEFLDPSHRIILDSLQWKHLSVTLFGYCAQCKRFPSSLLLKTILKDQCGVLEELSLSLDHGSRREFIQDFLQEFSFPRLRVLKLGRIEAFYQYGVTEEVENNIKTLVSLTPNLQELRVPVGFVDFWDNVLAGTSAVLLSNCELMNYTGQYCWGSMAEVIRFERMRLAVYPGHFSWSQFHTMMPDLLQRSHSTLHSLCIQLALLVPLMTYEISLDNLRKLAICLDVRGLKPDMMSLLKTFDFARIFPKLDRVITGFFHSDCPSESQISRAIERGNELWKQPLPNRAAKIKHLSVSTTLTELSAPFLAEMLPCITTLSVDPINADIPFGLIWGHWSHLKELYVRSYHGSRGRFFYRSTFSTMPNLDSNFCGIFPDEVAELRQKDDEFLRKVNIVPVMPSISCFTDLRTFKYYFQPDSRAWNYDPNYDPTRSITKVSGLIAFARCPGLAVTLQTVSSQDEEALRHMRPYATVVNVGCDIWPWNDMKADQLQEIRERREHEPMKPDP